MPSNHLAALVLAALVIASQTPANPKGPTNLPSAPDDIQAFVRAALEDRLAARSLPDLGLLGQDKRIAIREEMRVAASRLDDRALPHLAGYEFYMISTAAATTQAARTKNSIAFVTVDRPDIRNNDEATVWLGVDTADPPDPRSVKLCCCDGQARFRRVDGRWTFVEWGVTRCS
jgi:hypothetical protein